MKIELHRRVQLKEDDRLVEGIESGAVGVVIEADDDGFEVEFSRGDGTTIAWFAVRPDEIVPVPWEAPAASDSGRDDSAGAQIRVGRPAAPN